ncbi:hypothetical protein [Streptomyces sp. NPDC006645]|uniref:hypothetical protein n=1 Tax=unclassified Streptomyces TaxID=2593676 RepID=UPI0033ACAC4E
MDADSPCSTAWSVARAGTDAGCDRGRLQFARLHQLKELAPGFAMLVSGDA